MIFVKLSQHVRWVEGLWDVTFYVCFVDNNCGKKISLHLKSCFLFSVLRLGEGLMKCEVPLGLMGHIGFKCTWTEGVAAQNVVDNYFSWFTSKSKK